MIVSLKTFVRLVGDWGCAIVTVAGALPARAAPPSVIRLGGCS